VSSPRFSQASPRPVATMLKWILAALLILPTMIKAYVLPGALVARSAAVDHPMTFATRDACPCMSCRNNLKKDKRLRNRINAFRFKKGGNTRFNSRFNNFADKGAMKLKEESDAEFMALVFTAGEGAPEEEPATEEVAA